MITIELAGSLRVQHADVVVLQRAFGGRHATLAFAALLLTSGRALSTDGLADILWGERLPPTWQSMVRNTLTRVRRAVAPLGSDAGVALVGVGGQHHLLAPPDVRVDLLTARRAVDDAEACLAIGAAARAITCAAWVPDALRPPILAGIDSGWLDRRRDEAETLRVRALEVCASAGLAVGDVQRCLRATDELMDLAPLREDGYRLAMRAHAACGRRGVALQVYARCRQTLAQELGCGPDPATERLRALLDSTPTGSASAQRGRLTA